MSDSYPGNTLLSVDANAAPGSAADPERSSPPEAGTPGRLGVCLWALVYSAITIAAIHRCMAWRGVGLSAMADVAFQALIGGVIGYFTNCLALWMLFNPKSGHRFGPRWFFPNRIQPGLVVKRQPEVAKVIGEFSRGYLLNRRAIREHIKLTDARGQIERLILEKSEIWRDMAKPYADRLAAHISSRQFRKQLANWVDCQVRHFSAKELREFVSVEDRRRIAAFAASRAAIEFGGVAGRVAIGKAVRNFCADLEAGGGGNAADRLRGRIRRALPALVSENAGGIAEYLAKPEIAGPLRVGAAAEIGAGIRKVLVENLDQVLPTQGMTTFAADALIRGLSFDDSVERHLRENWTAWLARLTEAIKERRDDIAGAIYSKGEARIRDLLAKDGMNGLRKEIVLEAARLFAGRVEDLFSSGDLADFLAAKLDALCACSLDDLCPELVDDVVERITRELENLLESLFLEDADRDRLFGIAEQASLTVLSEGGHSWAELPKADRRRICARIARFADILIRRNIPPALEQLDLGKMVERQIMRFTPSEIEELALRTAKTEMRYIEIVGGVAGAAAAGGIQLFRVLFLHA